MADKNKEEVQKLREKQARGETLTAEEEKTLADADQSAAPQGTTGQEQNTNK